MAKSKIQFVSGEAAESEPSDEVRAYLDTDGQTLQLRLQHELDLNDQGVVDIAESAGIFTLRARKFYPERAPHLCSIFGIDRPGSSWPIVTAHNPDCPDDHLMVIKQDEEMATPDREAALEQTLKNLSVAVGRYMDAPDNSGLIDLEKPIKAAQAEAEDLISGDLEYSGSAALVEASHQRERGLMDKIITMAHAGRRLVTHGEIACKPDYSMADFSNALIMLEKVVEEEMGGCEVESVDADEPISIDISVNRATDQAYADAGIMPAGEYVAKYGLNGRANDIAVSHVDPEPQAQEKPIEIDLASLRIAVADFIDPDTFGGGFSNLHNIDCRKWAANIREGHGDPGLVELFTKFLVSNKIEDAFKITTGDPRFDPLRPIVVNGFAYVRDIKRVEVKEAGDV